MNDSKSKFKNSKLRCTIIQNCAAQRFKNQNSKIRNCGKAATIQNSKFKTQNSKLRQSRNNSKFKNQNSKFELWAIQKHFLLSRAKRRGIDQYMTASTTLAKWSRLSTAMTVANKHRAAWTVACRSATGHARWATSRQSGTTPCLKATGSWHTVC